MSGPELLAGLQSGELAFVTVREFALILRVSRQLVYELVETGGLEANRVGPRNIRIPAGAALAYLKQTSTGTGPPS